MKEPLVSILMPFRNTAAYLAECLDSIRRQSYANWELLAVDDHSGDGGPELLKSYRDIDPRIKLLKNRGMGIIPALRTAYKASSGQLITRMDSDDIMKEDKLKVLVRNLVSAGKGHISLGKVRYFPTPGISEGYRRYEYWLNDLTHKGSNFDERYKECVIPSPAWMVFREDLDNCGAFDSDLYPEDYDLTFRMFASGLQCLPCKDVLHLWRDYPSRTSRTSPNYADNTFLELKLRYFLGIDRDGRTPLFLWGAGSKGKTVARILLQCDHPFFWVCNNPEKIGKKIYGKGLLSYTEIQGVCPKPQSIVTVANATAQTEIRDFLNTQGFQESIHYFFFC